MKMFYVANVRLPTEKAHGIQIMNTCAALARKGVEIELVVPRRINELNESPFVFYGIHDRFTIHRIPCIDFIWAGVFSKVAFAIQAITFAAAAFIFLATKRFGKVGRSFVLYGRDESVLAFLRSLTRRIYWESHTGSLSRAARMLMRHAAGVVCISQGLAHLYENNGVSRDRLLFAPDAVDIDRFDSISSDTTALRQELKLPRDAFLVTYCGSLGLYSWKGIDALLQSCEHVHDERVRYVIVGGSDEEIARLKKKYSDECILFIGRVRPVQVPAYIKASDVLVLPNTAVNVVSERFTSPMKLFEYMASGVPIIASDLPSLREQLSEANAVLVPPGDPAAIAAAIQKINANPAEFQVRAKQAYRDVGRYTWDARAQTLISFISHA